MSIRVPVTNNALNLMGLKESMDEIVFNYIDTAQNWEKAYTSLDELVKNMVEYFNNYVNVSGELPKENTYWVLFMDVASKLIYFHSLAYYQLHGTEKEHIKLEVIELLTLAANCIPDVYKEANAEFLKEVSTSYEEIQFYNGKQGEFETSVVLQNNRAKECFQEFLKFTNFMMK